MKKDEISYQNAVDWLDVIDSSTFVFSEEKKDPNDDGLFLKTSKFEL